MANFGYHLTTKSSLYGIKKNGLIPKIGRRSYYVNEKHKLLYFTTDYKYLDYWKDTLYDYFFFNDNMPFDTEVVILKFNLDDVDYVKRSNTEYITEDVIQQDKIMVISVENPNKECRLSDLEIDLEIDEDKLRTKLEAKELFKNIAYIDPILFTSSYNKDGRLVLDRDLVNRLKIKNDTPYEGIWKNDLMEKVSDTFYTIIESNILYKYDVSEEWLLEFLLKAEYERQLEFDSQLLECCQIECGDHIVPISVTNEMMDDHEALICNDFSKISLSKRTKCAEFVATILNEIKKKNRNNNLLYLKNSETNSSKNFQIPINGT